MGKIYPEDRIGAALQGFFKIENLSALRELALREVAEDVESKRLRAGSTASRSASGRVITTDAPRAIGERLLALVEPKPESQRLIRRSWRSAQRLGADLDLLWVNTHAREPDGEEADQLAAIRRLASVLGAHLMVERHDDIVAAVVRIARERGTTYVLLGPPSPRSVLRRLREPLALRLVDALPGVDIRIVADRTRRATPGGRVEELLADWEEE